MRTVSLHLLSRRERQIMEIVYARGRVSAANVQEMLHEAPGYSAVRSALRLLEKKGLLTHQREGAKYVFQAKIPGKHAGQSALRRVMATFFRDSAMEAVQTILLRPGSPTGRPRDREDRGNDRKCQEKEDQMSGAMAFVNDLPVLQRLAVALLSASTVCTGAAWLATSLLRKRSAALRCQIWLAAFLSIVVFVAVQLSGCTLQVPVLRPTPRAAAIPAISKAVLSEAIVPSALSASIEPSFASLLPSPPRRVAQTTRWDTGTWIIEVWFLGVGVGLVRIIGGLLGLATCVRSAFGVDQNSRLGRLILESGYVENEVRLHHGVHSPISFGWPRTWVILPVQAMEWSDERLRIVLRHERAHQDRWDFVCTLLVRAIAIMCWPNPLVWLGLRRFRALCEDATDDRVVAGTDATAYAEELFRLLRDLRLSPSKYGLALSVAHGSATRGRIARLLDRWIDRTAPTHRQTLFVLASALAVAVSLGALRLVRADGLATVAPRSKDEAVWTQKLEADRVPTPLPTNAEELEAGGDEQASQEAWGKYWAKEHPRLWNLAETEREFLRRFPGSVQARDIQQEMIASSLHCLGAEEPIGKQALAWADTTLAQPDLSAEAALAVLQLSNQHDRHPVRGREPRFTGPGAA